ncbi:TKL family protein kinase [Histomonas meleagridis]|uniref:TKL family protein kinase n=1 Tax=Histomonas meleagridis TaxID=135588 RepID=UPI00355AB54A|nr:TKL family protein kinase [Histomonas meleagridis]KAH0806897.1 TKL family protein kinase [Histomonas meleagridis]
MKSSKGNKSKKGTYRRLEIAFKTLQALAGQTVVHRKKSEFAISQLHIFFKKFQEIPETSFSKHQKSDFSEQMLLHIQDLIGILNQNVLQTWTLPTIENKCNYVLQLFKEKFQQIQQTISTYLPNLELEQYIQPESDQWIQYNILDLRAISASFTQYLKIGKPDSRLADQIQSRIQSIEQTLSTFDSDDTQRVYSPIPLHYQSWKVDLKDFKYDSQIGRGVSAKVYKAIDTRPTTPPEHRFVAIKQLNLENMNTTQFQSFQRELAVLATVKHPSIIPFVGATDSPPFCLITEWMPNGSLYHDLHINHRLDATGRTIAAYDIARAMQYLHSRHISHRDLKSLNVLLDSNLKVKVCDFGFSRFSDETHLMTSNLGTIHWMAPELLIPGNMYTSKVDVYAYGILLWELVTCQKPYLGLDTHDIIYEVSHNDLRPIIPKDLNPLYADLIIRCWDRDPDIRPTFDEIVKLFRTKLITLNDADKVKVQNHINNSTTSIEQIITKIEKMVQKLKESKITINELYEYLKANGIPLTITDTLFNAIVELIPNYNISEICKLFLLFKTTKISEVSKILRTFPRNSIPHNIITEFIYELPTGSNETDLNILISACKNNSSDLCSLYVTKPEEKALALEITRLNRIDVRIREPLIDICIAATFIENNVLRLAALRLLFVMNELKRISLNELKKFFESNNKNLIFLSYFVLVEISDYKEIDDDLINKVFELWEIDNNAAIAIIALCKNKQIAQRAIGKIENNAENKLSVLELKILVAASLHEELKDKIKNIMKNLELDEMENRFKLPITYLKNL